MGRRKFLATTAALAATAVLGKISGAADAAERLISSSEKELSKSTLKNMKIVVLCGSPR